ncbi:patatin-like phospholipase family protein [Jeongeupia naejangsanensis]|uniref:Patatin-like phospholipase family protein n=1 Tax=Jeongeupia naejangsanensis TaxID=613195 RepID=A0ABS2BM98_9NEIS|nr:patatin-like phospholipase family protein [Jeongeupia naejangsanensis]MBM3116741.1 patatin-like phospholipase family protein [Jeongeupia naejangsanensis]
MNRLSRPLRPLFRPLFGALLTLALLAGCTTTPPAPPVAPEPPPKVRVGLALGGGAAKGFAHIGVIKMLEANGIKIDTVAGTSAGSVVGGLYASGLDAFALQEKAFGLDEAAIRDVSLLNGGIVKGQKLQDFVNQLVGNRPIDKFAKPFGAVATELDTGKRTVFVRGNAGQAIRASSSIPGVFEPALIAGKRYVDGGVVSPVPVDAARELGADIVIAVDISTKAGNKAPSGLIGTVNQAVVIMGQKLGEQELTRADVVIRPKVGKIGPTDFDQKNQAILEGEKAALAAIPQIKQKIAEKQQALIAARMAKR